MNILFKEYLTGDDREVAIMEAECDASLAKLDLLLETVQSTLKVNMLDAEAKVFAENGTYDDLTMLYTEAGEEAKEKSGNIFAAMFRSIGKFFGRIGQFFKERFGKQEAEIPETVQVDERIEQDMNAFTKCWNQLKNGVADLKNGNITGAKKIATIAIPTFVVLTGGAVGAYVAISKAKLKQHTETLEEAQQQIEGATTTADNLLTTGKAVVQFTGIVKAKKNPTDVARTEKKTTAVTATDSNKSEGEDGKSWIQKIIDKLKDFGSKILALIKKFWAWVTGTKKNDGTETATDKKVYKVAGRLQGAKKNPELGAGSDTPQLPAAKDQNEEPKAEESQKPTFDVKELRPDEQKQAIEEYKEAHNIKRKLNNAEKRKALKEYISKYFKESVRGCDLDAMIDQFVYEHGSELDFDDSISNELVELFADL